MVVLRIVLVAVSHLLLAFTSAVVAKGWDMDQLRSRSPASQIAGVIHDVLMYPHDSGLRALPNAWLAGNLHVVPLAIVLNSLLWGVALYGLWCAMRRGRERTPQARRPA